jgi:hypothetical protein
MAAAVVLTGDVEAGTHRLVRTQSVTRTCLIGLPSV